MSDHTPQATRSEHAILSLAARDAMVAIEATQLRLKPRDFFGRAEQTAWKALCASADSTTLIERLEFEVGPGKP